MTAADTTEDRVATLHSLLNDAAKKVGQQRERIKALEAEVAAHSSKTMTMVANHAALTDRLRDALRPFAEIAEHDIGDGEADHDLYHIISAKNAHAPLPRIGHFRRALSVLSGEAK